MVRFAVKPSTKAPNLAIVAGKGESQALLTLTLDLMM